MNKVSVVVTFLQGEMTINEKPFLEMCKTIFTSEFKKSLIPVKILFPKTGKVLYADENKFQSFINGEISTEDLINAVQCDAVVRNNEEVFVKDSGVNVEAGSLWIKRGKDCVLIHDDEHVTSSWDENKFIIL